MTQLRLKHFFVAATIVTGTLCCQQLLSNPGGAPAGVAGGVAESGATCFQSGCHFGSPTTVAGMITSDIPASGYVPGTTYNITATSSGSGAKGFQISPQNSSGQAKGTLMSGSGSFITGGNYITHSSAKTSSTATWTFKWKAPVAGSGRVTFFGAFAITRNTTRVSTLVANENTTTGTGPVAAAPGIAVYPNPVAESISINFGFEPSSAVQVHLYDLNGRRVAELFEGAAPQHLQVARPQHMAAGTYLLRISGQQLLETRKIFLR